MPRIFINESTAARRRVKFVAVADGFGSLAAGTKLQSSDMSGGTWWVRCDLNGAYNAAAFADPTQVDATNLKGLFYAELPTTLTASASGAVVGDKITVFISCAGGTESMVDREIEVEIANPGISGTADANVVSWSGTAVSASGAGTKHPLLP